jgi:hypothetical protein
MWVEDLGSEADRVGAVGTASELGLAGSSDPDLLAAAAANRYAGLILRASETSTNSSPPA